MAFDLKTLSVYFLVLLLLLLFSCCSSLHADGAEETLNNGSSVNEFNNRKLLVVNGFKAKLADFNMAGKSSKEEEKGWELRAAPLGPDPLHHHGAVPRKPRTP